MKIYILRHEDKTDDCTFFSPLTEIGLNNSIDLIKDLKKEKISKIYSSPYLGTLQTIYPYSEKTGLKINLEYSLIEIQHEDLIPKNSYKIRLPEYIMKDFNGNLKYTTEFEPENINYPEKIIDVKKRIKKFISNVIRNDHDSKDNILLVTHKLPINILINIAYKNKIASESNKENSDYDLDTSYPKGGLTEIFNENKWTFNPINWTYE